MVVGSSSTKWTRTSGAKIRECAQLKRRDRLRPGLSARLWNPSNGFQRTPAWFITRGDGLQSSAVPMHASVHGGRPGGRAARSSRCVYEGLALVHGNGEATA